MSVPLAYAASNRQNCLVGGDNSMRIDQTCNCASQGSCKQFNFPQEIPMPKEISPKAFKYQMETIKDLKNFSSNVANGDKSQAMFYGSRMTAKQKGLDAELGILQKAVNQNLVKNKSQPLDFSRETEKLKKDITNRVQRTFNSFPAEVRNSYNKRMSDISTPPTVADKAMASRGQRMKPVIARLKEFFKTLGPLGARKFTRKMENLKAPSEHGAAGALSLGGPGTPETLRNANGSNADNIDDYDMQYDDIIKDSTSSIFEAIHMRYLKQEL